MTLMLAGAPKDWLGLLMQQRPAIAVDVLMGALIKAGERSVVGSRELTPEHLRIALRMRL